MAGLYPNVVRVEVPPPGKAGGKREPRLVAQLQAPGGRQEERTVQVGGRDHVCACVRVCGHARGRGRRRGPLVDSVGRV